MVTLEDVSRTTIRLLMQEPFFGHLCVGMVREVRAGVSDSVAMAVCAERTLRLVIDPDYWATTLRTDAQRQGALKHQLLHVIFNHPLRAGAFANQRVLWIAADLVVNQHLSDEQRSDDAITLARFPMCPPGLSVDAYYKILMDHLQESGAPSEDASDAGEPEGSGDEAPEDALTALLQGAHAELDGHRSWHALSQLSAADARVVTQQVHGLMAQAAARVSAAQWSRLPLSLQRLVREALDANKPAVDWRRVLRLFAQSSRSTRVKNTLRRPSRRYGTVPGIRIQRQHRVMVVLDTSGSLNTQELAIFFREVHHLWREGAEVLIVECDAAIQRRYAYRGQPPEAVAGGGGTCFDPPLALANDEVRPDAILYFTDAYAAPVIIQPRAPILWLVSAQGAPDDSDWWRQLPGRKVRLQTS